MTSEIFKKDKFKNFNLSQSLQKVLVLIMIAVFIIFLICPLIMIFSKVFFGDSGEFVGLENFQRYFSIPSLFLSLLHSIEVSVITTIISVTLAFLFAYGLTRTAMKGKVFFRYAALLPLFVPTMVHGMALIYLFGKMGIFTKIGFDIGIYGMKGIILAEIVYTFPQALMILIVAMRNADNRLYEVTSVLGIGAIKTFLKVTLPGIKYGLISAITVSFTLCFTDFGTPQVVGGSYNVLSTDIYKQVLGQQNMSMGAVIGVILTIPAILAFIIDTVSQKKANAEEMSSKAVAYEIKENKKRDIFYQIYTLIITATIIVLFSAVIIAAVAERWPYDLTPTIKHFKFGDTLVNGGMSTFYSSIEISFFTAAIGTMIIFTTAYLIEKIKVFSNLRKICNLLAMMPMALPGLVVGLAYIMFFNKPYFDISFLGIRIENSLSMLYRTVIIMVIANIMHMFSVTFVTAKTALKKLDKEYENVADSLSIPFYKIFFRVTVPMSIEAILEIAMYLFVNSMVTVSVIVFLYTPDIKPASISILNMDDNGDYAAAAAMSVLILLTNIVVRSIYELITHKSLNKFIKWKHKAEDSDINSKKYELKGEKSMKRLKKVGALLLSLVFLSISTIGCIGKIKDNPSGQQVGDENQGTAEEGTINVYTALEDDIINDYLVSFKTEYPDIEVNIIRDSTGVVISKIIAEKDKPVADVVWGTAVTSVLSLNQYNLIEPYTPKGSEKLLDQFKDKEEPLRWSGIDVPEAAMLVNTDECKRLGIEVPKSYEDLIKSEYKGLITMPDPTASGTGLLIVNGILQIMGEEKGWKYLDKLNENISSYQSSGSKPAKMAATGECTIGLSMGYRCVSLKNEGNPVEAVFPLEGSGWDVEANCLIKKDNIKPAAKTFLDWAVSDNAMAAYGKEYPITAVGGNGTVPEGYNQEPIKNLSDDIDLYKCAENRQTLFDEFSKRYLSGK